MVDVEVLVPLKVVQLLLLLASERLYLEHDVAHALLVPSGTLSQVESVAD